ncbi:MAG: hydrogen gas-evolving membrane-bound hydrogenase subunit E [Acidimicrobiia bacterium]
MPLTLSIVAYFVVALILLMSGGRLRRGIAIVAAAPYAAQLILVLAKWPTRETASAETIEWIPSLGVTIGLRVDTVSLLLTTVVAGIGLLIVIYSDRYFPDANQRARFLGLLAVFTGGMAGIVASDELFGLFIFWEVTTVASYLLIGFDDDKAAARSAALQAILVTTGGGLAMLAGFVLLAMEGGTTTISALVADPPTGTTVTVALLLVFLGAFTKSAQFPFHFWLPGAMAAPTPASAYLHSATMVKAGIVLLLFLAPGFASTDVWLWVVTTIGLVTMAVGAIAAMRQFDLKLLLAYGTVSQLGFMTALIGLGYTGIALAVLIAHSLFKASLFLIVGIVDKSTGSRDARVLSGVGARLPLVAAAGAVAAASMAGIPPLLGFVTKEAAFDALITDGAWIALTVIAGASILTVSYSTMWWFGAFGNRPITAELQERPAYGSMVFGPVVLGILTIVLGLWPGPLGSAVSEAVGQSVKLVLWPGLKPALGLSAVVVLVGLVVAWRVLSTGVERLPTAKSLRLPTGARIYAWSLRALNTTAEVVTGVVQNGSLPVYVAVIISSVLFVPTVVWLFNWDATIDLELWNTPAEVVLAVVAVVGALAATRVQRRMAAVLLLGVVGYAVAGIYVIFSAPDLALTQLLIETLTVALFALVLVKLPRRFGVRPRSLSVRSRAAVSILAGTFVALGALITSTVTPDRSLTAAYVQQSEEAGGRNVVNIILTNFRALDTLGEITVLAAAAIGIATLLMTMRSNGQGDEA